MEWSHTPAEKADIEDLLRRNHTLIRALQRNWTKILKEDLNYRLNGQIPRNFVVNVRGGIGTPSGVFKSALGLNMARQLDPTFNVEQRVGFTPAELNRKIKEFGKKKQIFFLDEQIHDLKESQMLQLRNIVDSCREKQMCFIMCGIPVTQKTFSSYLLERFDESDDKYLPDKRVRYLIKNAETDEYRGHFIADIPNLNDKTGKPTDWGNFWATYMLLKSHHQEKVMQANITSFDFEFHANELLESGYEQFLTVNAKGAKRLDKGLLAMEVRKLYADFTKTEKDDIAKFAGIQIQKQLKRDNEVKK